MQDRLGLIVGRVGDGQIAGTQLFGRGGEEGISGCPGGGFQPIFRGQFASRCSASAKAESQTSRQFAYELLVGIGCRAAQGVVEVSDPEPSSRCSQSGENPQQGDAVGAS